MEAGSSRKSSLYFFSDITNDMPLHAIIIGYKLVKIYLKMFHMNIATASYPPRLKTYSSFYSAKTRLA